MSAISQVVLLFLLLLPISQYEEKYDPGRSSSAWMVLRTWLDFQDNCDLDWQLSLEKS